MTPSKRFLFLVVFLNVAIAVIFSAYVLGYQQAVVEPPPNTSGRINVVTTFLPLYVFTKNVAGDDAVVVNLLPNGVGPHEYAFKPSDVKVLAKANVVVENGLGLDSWVDDVLRESGGDARVIVASASVPTRSLTEAVAVPGGGEGEHGLDPHIWLDPVRAQKMVGVIADGLVLADPAHAEGYRARAAAYNKQLAALDATYKETLRTVPRRDFIAFHPAFGYLSERYGLTERAVIEEFPGTEPSAKYLAGLVTLIRKEKIRALFSEPQFSSAVVQTVAKETGLTVYELDTMETGILGTDTYLDVMKANLATIKKALSS